MVTPNNCNPVKRTASCHRLSCEDRQRTAVRGLPALKRGMHCERRTIVVLAALLAAACGPTLPPTTVPTEADPALAPFTDALKKYVDETQPYRKQAAEAANKVPDNSIPNVGATRSVRTRQNVLADALRTKLRPNAKAGEIFDGAADDIRRRVSDAFAGPRRDLLFDGLAEQNEGGKASPKPVAVNQDTEAPRVPPQLLDVLPPLPKQLEYGFVGRTLAPERRGRAGRRRLPAERRCRSSRRRACRPVAPAPSRAPRPCWRCRGFAAAPCSPQSATAARVIARRKPSRRRCSPTSGPRATFPSS